MPLYMLVALITGSHAQFKHMHPRTHICVRRSLYVYACAHIHEAQHMCLHKCMCMKPNHIYTHMRAKAFDGKPNIKTQSHTHAGMHARIDRLTHVSLNRCCLQPDRSELQSCSSERHNQATNERREARAWRFVKLCQRLDWMSNTLFVSYDAHENSIRA